LNTLLCGCSFSDYCGWNVVGDHSDARTWYNIAAGTVGLNLTNISYGGHSNREILHKINKTLLLSPKHFDLVLIQFSSTNRHWFFREENFLDYCIINGGSISNTRDRQEQTALETIQLKFNNRLIEIEKDMVSLIMLQNYLETQRIPLVLIDGMGTLNYINRLRQAPDRIFAKLEPVCQNDFGATEYFAKLSSLAKQINLNNVVGLDKSLRAQQIDFADDHMHPGELSNQLYAELVCKTIVNITKDKL
jgi:hypothetical protein